MGTALAKPKSAAAAVRARAQRGLHGAGLATRPTGGVVKFYVQGSSEASGAAKFSPAKLVQALQIGLPFREFQDLQASLGLPVEKLASLLGISKATFHRRKGAAGKLPSAVSDRLVRYARLLGLAAKVFDDLEAAKRWLHAPQFGLAGATPLDYAKTEFGAREVENLLGRIEYGVYS